jgi:hypothetical protein
VYMCCTPAHCLYVIAEHGAFGAQEISSGFPHVPPDRGRAVSLPPPARVTCHITIVSVLNEARGIAKGRCGNAGSQPSKRRAFQRTGDGDFEIHSNSSASPVTFPLYTGARLIRYTGRSSVRHHRDSTWCLEGNAQSDASTGAHRRNGRARRVLARPQHLLRLQLKVRCSVSILCRPPATSGARSQMVALNSGSAWARAARRARQRATGNGQEAVPQGRAHRGTTRGSDDRW